MAPASAAVQRAPLGSGWTYVQARAAALGGDYVRSANLFAALAQREGDEALARRAIATAITAGDSRLALSLIRRTAVNKLSLEAKLLLVADELRNRRTTAALGVAEATGADIDISFLGPLIRAWDHAERKDLAGALASLDAMPAGGVLAPYRDQQRALILLKLKRPADAAPLVERSLGSTGLREERLRFAFADGYLHAGDRARAAAVVEDLDLKGTAAKQRIRSGKPLGQSIDTSAKALSDVLTGLALSLSSRGRPDLPIALLQVARTADPANSSASLLLGYMLARADRASDALAAYRSVPQGDPFASNARQLEAGLLAEEKRDSEALALAQAQVARGKATATDYEGLAQVLFALGRNSEAADAYARAIALAGPTAKPSDLWPLYLNRASALEQADRWPEAKRMLQVALALAPDEPLILNNLGYSQLERGEDLEQAEAMIRKASALAPEDASITDSLGWALYKQGRVEDAIEILEQASVKDPAEPEIREHLGDALFTAGRRYEARFAWTAALVTADGELARRVKAKLESGLTAQTAAP